MGEIKSTLDIIMEKTKGLTMTDEEKKAFQKKEIEGKARGLLQKFLDSYIDLKGLKKEIAGLDEKRQIMIKEALRREGLARVKLDADNTKLFDLLENHQEAAKNYYQTFIIVNGDLGKNLPWAQSVPLGSGDFYLFALKDMGFLGIANPITRKTLGKMITIPQGCKRQGKDLNDVIKKLQESGFEVKS